jgi:integrase
MNYKKFDKKIEINIFDFFKYGKFDYIKLGQTKEWIAGFSFATHLLESGTDISHIQQLPGHNSIQTAVTYAKVAQKNLKKIKSPLDGL